MLAALRAALGPDVVLRADANRGWPLPRALAFGAAVAAAGVGLQYVEEPTDDPRDMGSFFEATGTRTRGAHVAHEGWVVGTRRLKPQCKLVLCRSLLNGVRPGCAATLGARPLFPSSLPGIPVAADESLDEGLLFPPPSWASSLSSSSSLSAASSRGPDRGGPSAASLGVFPRSVATAAAAAAPRSCAVPVTPANATCRHLSSSNTLQTTQTTSTPPQQRLGLLFCAHTSSATQPSPLVVCVSCRNPQTPPPIPLHPGLPAARSSSCCAAGAAPARGRAPLACRWTGPPAWPP